MIKKHCKETLIYQRHSEREVANSRKKVSSNFDILVVFLQ